MDSETGTRLKEIRTKTGLSQRQLAKASGVANATISQIESGAINPTVGCLKRYSGEFPLASATSLLMTLVFLSRCFLVPTIF